MRILAGLTGMDGLKTLIAASDCGLRSQHSGCDRETERNVRKLK